MMPFLLICPSHYKTLEKSTLEQYNFEFIAMHLLYVLGLRKLLKYIN